MTAAKIVDADGRGSTPVGSQCKTSTPWQGNQIITRATQIDDLLHQEVFGQWDALIQRQGHEAYAVHKTCSSSSISSSSSTSSKDAQDRQVLAQWCFNVVDAFNIDRGVVSIAISYFDRFRLSSASLHTNATANVNATANAAVAKIPSEELSLAMLTCLHLAIKVHSSHPHKLSSYKFVELSRNQYSTEDIDSMEARICVAVGWYLNPPVSDMFLNIITPLLEKELPMPGYYVLDKVVGEGTCDVIGEIRHQLVQQAKFLCERSVLDVFFTDKNASCVALAAIMVALDLMSFPIESFQWFVSLPLVLRCDADEVNLCIQHIHEVCIHEKYAPYVRYDTYTSDRTPHHDEDDKVGNVVRSVTPLKGDVSTKRTHHEATSTVEFQFELESDTEDVQTGSETTPKMRRVC